MNADLIYLLKKCRIVLNMAGYYDMVEQIDKALAEHGEEVLQ